jgi:hypothetical protein
MIRTVHVFQCGSADLYGVTQCRFFLQEDWHHSIFSGRFSESTGPSPIEFVPQGLQGVLSCKKCR